MKTELRSAHPLMPNWSNACKNRTFTIQFVITLFVLISIALSIPYFFDYVQKRNGSVLNDPLLNLMHPVNLSTFTFTLIYASVFVSIGSLIFYPERLLLLLQAYCLLTFFRVICMWLVPLNEPAGIIVLQDPLVGFVGYGGKIITKDLFFSGHASTMFLLYLAAMNKLLKKILLAATGAIATMILIQHVHYTIDVLAAPLFSWLAFVSVKKVFH